MKQKALKRRKNLLELRMKRTISLAELPCNPPTIHYVQTLTLALPSGQFAESSLRKLPPTIRSKGITESFSFYQATQLFSPFVLISRPRGVYLQSEVFCIFDLRSTKLMYLAPPNKVLAE